MRKLALLAGLSCVYAVRLDVSDEFKTSPVSQVAALAESVDEINDDPSSVVITAGFEKCRVLVTSDSKFTHFKKDLKIVLPSDKYPEFNTFTNWVMYSQAYWQFQTDSNTFADAWHYPRWDSDSVKFNFHLTQYDTDTTHVMGHYVNLPARRLYIVVIGSVEHNRDSDRREDEWKPKYACSSNTLISPKYLIDIFRTGDDLTEYVQTKKQILDYQVIGSPDSTIHARKTDYEIDGNILKVLGKTADRKAFWIRDATYIDALDKRIELPRAAKDASKRDDVFTFWAALEKCRGDASMQNDYFEDALKMPILNCNDGSLDACKPGPGNTGAFFGDHAWDSEHDYSFQQFPVVACGLFGKVWPIKECHAKKMKSESEMRG